jgi:acetyltransferase-like isoleucine patch superfamily enzyme
MPESHVPTIAIITPTLGRPTLQAAIDSGLPQLGSGDEWLIVGDGSQPAARETVCSAGDDRLTFLEHHDPHSTYGNAQRNYAMRQAKADFFLFLDDDQLLPSALDAIRREGVDRTPLMFRMDYRPRGCTLWKEPVIREGNVGGSMFVVPNVADRRCDWPETERPSVGDLAFINQTLSRWPDGALRWCEDVICRCEWHGHGQKNTVQQGERVTIHPTANVYGSRIGDDTQVAAFVEIGGSILGARCKVQAFAFIPPGVTIGDEVFIGPHVCFTNDRHPRAVGEWTLEATRVERGANIGANATILPGLTIGAGATIGAGVTVTRSIPPGTIFKGETC